MNDRRSGTELPRVRRTSLAGPALIGRLGVIVLLAAMFAGIATFISSRSLKAMFISAGLAAGSVVTILLITVVLYRRDVTK
jgi:hypothetical protein